MSKFPEIDLGPCHADTLRAGKGFQGYCGYPESREWAAKVAEGIPHDVWYTERQGDPITLVVPKGTNTDLLPSTALMWQVFEWIAPEGQFNAGQGIVPMQARKT